MRSTVETTRRCPVCESPEVPIVWGEPPAHSLAGDIAEITQARTLEALHLAAAQRVGAGTLPLLTADLRQAQAARSMGWTVIGVQTNLHEVPHHYIGARLTSA